MKISLAWLNTYLDRPIDGDEASVRLEEQGFPIEGREPVTTSTGTTDEMLDVEVTSNRGDCLSHIGVAREIAAGTDRSLLLNDEIDEIVEIVASGGDAKHAGGNTGEDVGGVSVEPGENAGGGCSLYTARVIRGVRVGASPAWLVDRLEAIGLRSVNNVVDVTNFVLHEMGQPLHAFDLNKLEGRGVVVRRAKQGETITAIDGTKHALRANMLVIADEKKPVAIAGVMGGLDTEVGEQTTDVLLESAVFDALSVRRTSRALRLSSDSSYRFERGLDQSGVARASLRAAGLITKLAGGELVGGADGAIVVGEAQAARDAITLRLSRCEAVLGMALPVETITGILESLGITVAVEETQLVCTVPSYRLDLEREIDLIEEVARMYGLNRIPVHDKLAIVTKAARPEVVAGRQLVNTLVAHGYLETVTFSFVTRGHGQMFLPSEAEGVEISDERRKAEPMLRPSVLPSLLLCRKSNQDAGNSDVRLFETASVWHREADQIVERRELGMLADVENEGGSGGGNVGGSVGGSVGGVRGMRGVIEELLTRLGVDDVVMKPVEDALYSVAAVIERGGQVLGRFGLLSKSVQGKFDLHKPVVLASLDAAALVASYPPKVTVEPLPKFPGIERDLSVIVEDSVPWQAIEAVVKKVNPPMMSDLSFLTTYRGKQIGAGRKSVSLRLLFRDPEKTLRHDEVDPQMAVVIDSLKNELSAELRG